MYMMIVEAVEAREMGVEIIMEAFLHVRFGLGVKVRVRVRVRVTSMSATIW